MIAIEEKPIHWAEAFGLSALAHVCVVYFVLTSVIDLRTVFENPEQTPPSLQITSLSLEANDLTSVEIGSGTESQNSPQTLAPLADVISPVAPVETLQNEAKSVASVQGADVPPPVARAPLSAPDLVSPLRPETATLSPVAVSSDGTPHDNSTDVPPSIDSNVAEVSVANRELVQPINRDAAQVGDAAAPEPSNAALPETSAEPDPFAADLINRIRSAVGEECVIAIPQQDPNGDVSVQIFAADESKSARFAEDIFADLEPRPAQITYLVDPRQCAALDYIRQSIAYPTSPLSLSLDLTRIPSGAELSGRISGTGGRNLSVILIDDNGVVQSLGAYMNVAVNTARFAAPLRRAGTVRDTQQLLLALGTNAPPRSIAEQNGQIATDYFDALADEISNNAALALVPFEVR